ncbi:hypothetical protein [uncultured Pyramidobacter sp.]|uniref:P-II family nitrogen regulator n=1 Tax=uncultured Pyramidobacter sp. TaxID=1623495 RepID=UPI00258B7437|nr:hypothetical protein [uncultured Pyramidobacter sp.]
MTEKLPVMELMVTIVDRTKAVQATNFFKGKNVYLTLSCWGRGTASTEILDILGIGEKEKVVVFSLTPRSWIPALITQISDDMQLRNAGRGILFTIPLSSVNQGTPRRYLSAIREKKNEERVMYKTNENKYELIIVSTEDGFVDSIMKSARNAGARGGTVMRARAVGDENTESFFGLKLYDEMEILAILVQREEKLKIMSAVSKTLAEKSPEMGTIFSVPVDDVVGVGAVLESPDPA